MTQMAFLCDEIMKEMEKLSKSFEGAILAIPHVLLYGRSSISLLGISDKVYY
jgi:hypothetical protein